MLKEHTDLFQSKCSLETNLHHSSNHLGSSLKYIKTTVHKAWADILKSNSDIA